MPVLSSVTIHLTHKETRTQWCSIQFRIFVKVVLVTFAIEVILISDFNPVTDHLHEFFSPIHVFIGTVSFYFFQNKIFNDLVRHFWK